MVNPAQTDAAFQAAVLDAVGADTLSIGLILAGVVCQLLRRRLPAGLGASLFVGMASIGLALAAAHHHVLMAVPIEGHIGRLRLPMHLAAGLCAVWAVFGWASSLRSDLRSEEDTTSASTFFAWSLVCGIAASVPALYVLVFGTWERLVAPEGAALGGLRQDGISDVLAMLLALGLWWMAHRREEQPVVFCALTTLLAWWLALMVPMVTAGQNVSTYAKYLPAWWHWTLQLELGLAAVVVCAVVMVDLSYRRRRRRAWPDRLDDLIAPYPRSPALHAMLWVLASAVLVLGVYQIVRRGPWNGPLNGVNATILAGTAAACLFAAYRSWSPAAVELGLALVTLSVATLACATIAVFLTADPRTEYVNRVPIVFNTVIVAFGFMAGHMYWLSRFWRQQLNDGVPWTTTGQMIPHARRVAFLTMALAVLVAFQMALWPELVPSADEDNRVGRLISGALAYGVLIAIGLREARRTASPAPATLCVAALIAGVLFFLLRAPASVERGWLFQYDSVVLSLICLPILALAEVAPRTRWRTFALPLWYLALLILPARALYVLLLSEERLPAEWVQPMTLAILGAVFCLAGNRPGRRPFLVLGAVLLVAGLINVYRVYRG